MKKIDSFYLSKLYRLNSFLYRRFGISPQRAGIPIWTISTGICIAKTGLESNSHASELIAIVTIGEIVALMVLFPYIFKMTSAKRKTMTAYHQVVVENEVRAWRMGLLIGSLVSACIYCYTLSHQLPTYSTGYFSLRLLLLSFFFYCISCKEEELQIKQQKNLHHV